MPPFAIRSDPESDLIFVSIASYRDTQLVATIEDCLAKARHPERLRFGICRQDDVSAPPLRFAGDSRFRILDIDWRQSRGACWARAEVMNLHQGEPWFLQIDSHCRFASAWDTRLIQAALLTLSPKPILSTYATPFTPNPDAPKLEVLTGLPQLMAIERFTPEGLPYLKPLDIPVERRSSVLPVRARFLAAGFLFAPGSFVLDVPYDAELYFFGEEISMTLRAYTQGYDLFHPMQVFLWHDYVRAYATRHWEDHTTEKAAPHAWADHDTVSREKVRRLLKGEDRGEAYGLGLIRTLPQYEAYAGISFHLRKMHDYTRRAEEPPNPLLPADWPDRIYTWYVRIVFDPKLLPEDAFDPAFWYVAIQDEEGREIYRRDFPAEDLVALTRDEPRVALVCEIASGIVPASWTVWPVTRDKRWLDCLHGKLDEEDFAIISDEDEGVEES